VLPASANNGAPARESMPIEKQKNSEVETERAKRCEKNFGFKTS